MNAVLQYQSDWDEWLRHQAALLREGRLKIRNAYRNPARQAAMQVRAWRTARKVLEHVLSPTDARMLPRECPFTWEQLRDDDDFG